MIGCPLCSGRLKLKFTKLGYDYWSCVRCGLELIYPQPDMSVLSAIYGNNYYDAWGGLEKKEVGDVKRNTFERVLRLIPLRKGAKILDCGCAAGYLMFSAQNAGFLPYGVEINDRSGAIAAGAFGRERVFSGRLEDCGFPPGSFYAVFMNDFIEHASNIHVALRKASELLENNGYLILTTPDVGTFSRRIMGKAWPHYKTEHLFYFNRKNIALFLKGHGFRLLRRDNAVKTLSLDYLCSYFKVYPNALITFLSGMFWKLLPERLKFARFSCYFGEMAVLAQKES